MPRIAFGIDRHDVANSRLRCRVEVDALNERDGSSPLVQFNHVIVHVLRQMLLSFLHRIAESVFVISMNVNGTADFFTDAESFRSLGEFICHVECRLRPRVGPRTLGW